MFSRNFNLLFFSIILLTMVSCGNFKKSQFELPSLFSDGMVLQRDTLVTLLGRYIPNQKINISCSWGFDTITFSDSILRKYVFTCDFDTVLLSSLVSYKYWEAKSLFESTILYRFPTNALLQFQRYLL